MGKSIIGKAYFLSALLLAASAALAQTAALHPGIVGADDRQRVEEAGFPWDAVGQVNIAGYRQLGRCTGTLIAPDMVITAAHCLVDGRKRATFPAHNIHFLAGLRGDRNKGHARARCVRILGGYDLGTVGGSVTLDAMARDAALIVLEDKLAVEPAGLADAEPADFATPLTHAAYAADRRFALSAHAGCRRLSFADRRPIWYTDCDTHPASSGGPVFAGEGKDRRIVAIMVGAGHGRANIALPVSVWRGLVGQNCGA
jgi:V8-like Glu-specific endopeptidase